MSINNHIIYMIGIGGIGMSALARYFLLKNCKVYGYDANPSENTQILENLGATIHFDESTKVIESLVSNYSKNNVLVIYTPAINSNSSIIQWIIQHQIPLFKRSEILGNICKSYRTLAVAGTHGKTTISSILAHILYQSEISCTAFLGGIVKNYQSNFLFNDYSPYVVVEADEYDRSFLHLYPEMSVITYTDPDHLDIYHSYDALKKAYQDYINNIKKDGKLLINKVIDKKFNTSHVSVATYSIENVEADCTISNLKLIEGYYSFNIHTPWGTIENIKPGITGKYNVENVLSACSLALWMGIDSSTIKRAIENFKGIKRRFDVIVHNGSYIYIDDYAHHPEEIKALIKSVRGVFSNIPVTGIFQPHLYSRTKDLADEFAEALSLFDELCLLPIYPARELPVEGVSSSMIFEKIKIKNKELIDTHELLEWVKRKKPRLLVTLGAGNIDQWVEPIKALLHEN